MKTTKEKYNFQYTFKLSLIMALLLVICLFEFYPTNSSNTNESITRLFDKNDIVFIPATTQQSIKTAVPKLPQIVISEEITAIQILEDVTINSKNTEERKTITAKILLPINYQPRQTLEVIPQKISDNIKGYIKISIKIGADGKAKDYKILVNTTESKECLKEVINAVFRSKWESFNLISSTKNYWINKTYRFN